MGLKLICGYTDASLYSGGVGVAVWENKKPAVKLTEAAFAQILSAIDATAVTFEIKFNAEPPAACGMLTNGVFWIFLEDYSPMVWYCGE